MQIKKMVIPAAGLGTRFLPYTKAVPKEMLPLGNLPALHYIIQEGVNSGIEQFYTILSKNKQAIEDYFDPDTALQNAVAKRGKLSLLSNLIEISQKASHAYIRQSEAKGLGHAISLARNVISDEFFGVCLPDDIIMGSQPALAQLIAVARKHDASVIAIREVPQSEVSSYGVIAIEKKHADNLFQIQTLVEKPRQQDAPSCFAIVGRYVLSSALFPALDRVGPDKNNEIQVTEGIRLMIEQGHKVFAHVIEGQRHDVGTPFGWLKAAIAVGLENEEYGETLQNYVRDLVSSN